MKHKVFIAMVAALIMAGISAIVVSGSSHNDAPLAAEDPTANNTDVYAFVSTEAGRSDFISLIANYIPMEEPGNGPTHYRFSDQVLYEIMVDVDGDANEDITYELEFKNNVVNGNTILYNAGKIGLPPDPSDPSSQYENLNVQQSFTLTEVAAASRKDDGSSDDDKGKRGTKRRTVLLQDARLAPANVGPNSTGTPAEYEALAEAAIHPIADGGKVFVGPRDEGFYIDLMGFFDLLNLRDPAFDTFSGFNVHTIALEIPKSRFVEAGDTDGIIGTWASASRPKLTLRRSDGRPPTGSKKMVQVSRLGNPLVNELLMPLEHKDRFNATEPKKDAKNTADFIVNPASSQSAAALIPVLIDFLDTNLGPCNTPVDNRFDLDLILLKGIPAGVLGLPGTQDTQQADGPVTADMLRLNFNVPPSADPSSLGVFGGDLAGFPNGRRVGDDVPDIFARAGAGAVLELLDPVANDCPISLLVSDNVQENDVDYLDSFPYLGTPHEAYVHEHSHSGYSTTIMSTSAALIGGGILLGGVFAWKRRKDSSEDLPEVSGEGSPEGPTEGSGDTR